MGDRSPDPLKQTEQCKKLKSRFDCPYLEETGGGFKGEQYECDICGCRIYLDYEEMK